MDMLTCPYCNKFFEVAYSTDGAGSSEPIYIVHDQEKKSAAD